MRFGNSRRAIDGLLATLAIMPRAVQPAPGVGPSTCPPQNPAALKGIADGSANVLVRMIVHCFAINSDNMTRCKCTHTRPFVNPGGFPVVSAKCWPPVAITASCYGDDHTPERYYGSESEIKMEAGGTGIMPSTSLSVTATFEDGVLRPEQPLPLASRQRVTLLIQVPPSPNSCRASTDETEAVDTWSCDDTAIREAMELDSPTPIEIPRTRALVMADPDEEFDTEV